MKRIKYACLEQTIHFMLKEDPPQEAAAAAVQNEVKAYKAQLNRSGTKHRIVSEALQEDGSVLLKIRKQYDHYGVGDYLA